MSSFLPVHLRPSIVLRWYYAIAKCGDVLTFCALCRERGWVTLKLSLYISGPFNLPDVTIKRISNLREVPVPTLDVKVRISLLPSVYLKDFPVIFLSACIRSARFFMFPVANEKFWSPRPWMSLIFERKSRLCTFCSSNQFTLFAFQVNVLISWLALHEMFLKSWRN